MYIMSLIHYLFHLVTNREWSLNDTDIRLVLFGKAKCGKNATRDTILGVNSFQSPFSSKSTRRFEKRIVAVIMPDIFESKDQIEKEISKCISLSSPGPHAFIMVLSIASEFTEEDERTIEYFEKYFGEQFYRYLIVLFTHRDKLSCTHKHLEDYINQSPSKLRILCRNNGRVVTFDNTLKGIDQEDQVMQLLHMILSNVEEKGGVCYTTCNEMYMKVEQMIQNTQMERQKEF